jgi:hypothetical protein
MPAHTHLSIRSPVRRFRARLVLVAALALLLSPQGLLAQTALSVQRSLTQANENLVEEGMVGLLGSGAYRAWGSHSRGKHGSVGGTCEFGTSTTYGASCQHDNGNAAYLGTDLSGVYGESINGHFGRLGTSSEGVYGENNNGNSGSLGEPNHGVYGAHNNGTYGYLGGSTIGVYGEHANGSYGFLGGFFTGVYGTNGGGFGYLGGGFYGAYGETSNGNFGYLGGGDYGV